MKTQVWIGEANCPVCLNSVSTLLEQDPRVHGVRVSFAGHCLEVEHDGLSDDDLARELRDRLHGIDVAGNGERVMVEVHPEIGDWHCQRQPTR